MLSFEFCLCSGQPHFGLIILGSTLDQVSLFFENECIIVGYRFSTGPKFWTHKDLYYALCHCMETSALDDTDDKRKQLEFNFADWILNSRTIITHMWTK